MRLDLSDNTTKVLLAIIVLVQPAIGYYFHRETTSAVEAKVESKVEEAKIEVKKETDENAAKIEKVGEKVEAVKVQAARIAASKGKDE